MKASVLAMRRRSVWEAADSGILLWRKNFLLFLPFFALPVLITAAALYFIPNEYRWISWLGLWWLKPFFDRLCLHVISKRFFTDSAGSLSSGLAHTLFSSLSGDLLWRRFSPFRCSVMPLRLMERLKSKQYEERKKTLARGGLYFSALISCLGLPLELFLLGGEIIFFTLLFDLFFSGSSLFLLLNYEIILLLIYAAYCVNYILVESLYVCMGFGIYINSRIEVEGWDIELLFRRFSAKAAGLARGAAKILFVVSLLCFFPPLYAREVPGEDIRSAIPGMTLNDAADIEAEEKIYFPPDFMPVEKVPLNELEEILGSGDFGGTRPSWRIKLRNPVERDVRPPPVVEPWFDELREILAQSLRILIIVIFSGIVIFLLVRLYQLRQLRKPIVFDEAGAYSNPLVSKGRPEVFFEKAEMLFEQGLYRDAWAACLCGALNAFNMYLGVVFPKQMTEYGCLDLVRERFAADMNLTAGFGDLIRNWVFLAYGARLPAQNSFEKALEYGRSLIPARRKPGQADA